MNSEFLSNNNKYLFFVNLLTVYLIILGFRGFLFSSNDVADIMSYSKFLNDPELYPFDFYIQNISGTIPNERYVVASFIALFGDHISWLSILMHAFFSMLLFAGIVKLSKLFIRNSFVPWLIVLILAGPLYGSSIGDCELYYNMFIASLAAKSIAIWSIYFLFTKKQDLAFFLLIPVSFIHPTVGAQLFLILISIFLFHLIFERTYKGYKGALLYLSTAGIWIYLLQFNVYEGAILETSALFEIFEFRLAHHFFPEYFNGSDWLFSLLFIAVSFYYFNKKRMNDPLLFVGITVLGMVIYSLSIWILPVEIVLSSQWFKSYIWIELIGLISVFSIAEPYFNFFKASEKLSKFAFPLLWIAALSIFVLIHFNNNFIGDKKHELFYLDQLSDEAIIGILAKENTPKDAVFVVPIEFTEFKYYSERSLYIDYKTVVHRKNVLGEWYDRIRFIYDIDITDRLVGKDLYSEGNNRLFQKKENQYGEFIQHGIQYIVTPSNKELKFPVIAESTSYKIYKIELIN
jgi:hypothetical protein